MGDIVPLPVRTLRYAHELICSGCDQPTHCAVHWGPIDLCMTCQFLGPEQHRAFLAITRDLAQPIEREGM